MTPKEVVDYWLELAHQELGLVDLQKSKESVYQYAHILETFSIDDTGIFAYVIVPDMRGGVIFAEMLFYIRKENRGSIKLVKKYIDEAERLAKEKNCNSIKIGSNIGHKDEIFIKMLQRWGYHTDTVSKGINNGGIH